MRFTLLKKLEHDTAMRPIMSALLLFMALFLLSDILLKEANFGLFTAAIERTLFGNEEEYVDPISRAIFLEMIHTEIFFMMMILLTLSAIFGRVMVKSSLNVVLLNVLMLSALSSLFALVLAYFYSKLFVGVYVVSFFLWHLLAFYMLTYSLWRLHAKSL